MGALRGLTFALVLSLVVIGCHQPDQATHESGAVAPPPTPTADRTQMHNDAATAAATMQTDAATMKADTAAMQPTTAPAMASAMPGAADGAMGGMSSTTAPAMVAVAHMMPSKSATTMPVNNDVTGTVTFTQQGDKVLVVADITGLEPNTRHGIHIHEKGDLSDPGLLSTGGHWNPDHHIHGGPSTSPVHAGDLGNLDADATGTAHLELTLSGISVGGMKNDVIGHAVIIHAKADDLSSQPSGNAGARVAGGVIELQPVAK
jgi:Cu-Zn family superoxide dismutase